MRYQPALKIQRIALREWLILSVALIALLLLLQVSSLFKRADFFLYDSLMQWNSKAAREDIVIVAIDDYSLAELGRWPWPRENHAQLLQRLQDLQTKAIGLDFLFTEAEAHPASNSPTGDEQLAQQIATNKNVVLALAVENAGKGLQPALPYAKFAQAAADLGHIHLELDSDGVARSVFLFEGMNQQKWPHFALALAEIGGANTSLLQNKLATQRLPRDLRNLAPSPGTWQRDYQMYIPFHGGRGHFSSVPYVAVLRGEVPASLFKNKYVLVGPTATAMADSYPTPVSGNEGVIPGVEINAHVLSSVLNESSIRIASLGLSIFVSCSILGLALLGYQMFSPRRALLLTIICAVLAVALSLGALLSLNFWYSPVSLIFCLLLAYPLWSWRRLEAALRYLSEEFRLLDKEPHLLPEMPEDDAARSPRSLSDELEVNINALHQAASRVRDLRQFVSDSLSSLPDATLVAITDGNVLLANQAARDYFASLGFPQVVDSLLPYLFTKLSEPTVLAEQKPAFSWWNLLDLNHSEQMMQGIEVRDAMGKDILVKSAPCYNAQHTLVGWIVSVIDISRVRAAERSRDETLHFISHDMRAPQASILALLEMQKEAATALPQAEFFSRIEKSARATLGLADNFVQLAKAESQTYRFEEVDFQDILLVACEEMWTLAKNKQIRIKTEVADIEYPALVDRGLMTRVLTNLLSNAIKYSPAQTQITCRLSMEQSLADAIIVCSIQDQGYGMTRADQTKLFQRFQRFALKDQPKNDGIGLGMVFVKAVLDRHHAKIEFISAPNEGTTFTLRIPADLD